MNVNPRFKEGIVSAHISDGKTPNCLLIELNSGKEVYYRITEKQQMDLMRMNHLSLPSEICGCRVLIDEECIAILPKGATVQWNPSVCGKDGEDIQPHYMLMEQIK